MVEDCVAHGLPAPKFVQEEEDLNTVIYRNVARNTVKNVVRNVLEDKYKKLTERQRFILNKMNATANHDVVENVVENNTTLAAHFSVNERTIQRDLAVLQSEGFLRHIGPNKGGKWIILYNLYSSMQKGCTK